MEKRDRQASPAGKLIAKNTACAATAAKQSLFILGRWGEDRPAGWISHRIMFYLELQELLELGSPTEY